MARPKKTRDALAAEAERDDDPGRADADISDAEHARNKAFLLAKLLEFDKADREARRRLKAGLPRWPGDNGERRT